MNFRRRHEEVSKYIPNQLQLNKQKSKPCCKIVQCMYKLRGNLYDFCHTCAQQWFCQWANRQTESYPVWIFLIFCQKDFLQMPDFWTFSNLVHISTGYIRFYLNHQHTMYNNYNFSLTVSVQLVAILLYVHVPLTFLQQFAQVPSIGI